LKALGRVVLAGVIALLFLAPSVAISATGSRPVAPPHMFSPRNGPPRGLLPGRDVLWSQPPDLNGFKYLSEVNEVAGIDLRVADDFTLPNDTNITRVAFWGGPYWGSSGDPGPTSFNIQILDNYPCSPSSVLLDLPGVSPEMTFAGYDGNGDAVYRYEVDMTFHAQAGVEYWLVAQAVGQSYPPLWGRQQAVTEIGCGAMWNDGFYWEWDDCGNSLGFPYDAAFELIDETGPQGACCYTDGRCVIVVRQVCDDTGGVWLGGDFACAPNPCEQETGACCMPDLQCLIRSASDCIDTGGAWQGVGTTCHPDPCQPTPIERTTWGRIKEGYR
jgi:hypothetical protein